MKTQELTRRKNQYACVCLHTDKKNLAGIVRGRQKTPVDKKYSEKK